MSMRVAEQVADAVLYEGYVLYPYRASAAKNRQRWQVGLVMPQDYAAAVGSDPWFAQTECLAEPRPGAALTVRVRCLQVQERTIEAAPLGRDGEWRRVETLRVADRDYVTWDEAVMCEFVRDALPLETGASEVCLPWTLPANRDVEPLTDETGSAAGRIVRSRRTIEAVVRIATEVCGGLLKVRVRIENVTPSGARTLAERDSALRQSLAGAHTLLAIENGAFVSLLDPPPVYSALAASCVNEHAFPVLAGPAGSRQVILSSPIILYDHPAVAPESQGDLCDATEIDELLTLRVRTLTDEEKREARATDDRAARIVDRCDAASPATIAKLHGAARSLESFLNPPGEPEPEAACVDVGGVRVARGSRVRVQPRRISDSLDLCLGGRSARVTAVYRTLEGAPYVAVTLDDDPFGAAGVKYRRSLFFHPDELAPIEGGEA